MNIFFKIFFGLCFSIVLSHAHFMRIPCHRKRLKPPVITTVLRNFVPIRRYNPPLEGVPQFDNHHNFQAVGDPPNTKPESTPQLLAGRSDFGTVRQKAGLEGPELVTAIPRVGTMRPGLGTMGPGLGTLGPDLGTAKPKAGAVGAQEGSLRPVLVTITSGLGTLGIGSGTVGPGLQWVTRTVGSREGTVHPRLRMEPGLGTIGLRVGPGLPIVRPGLRTVESELETLRKGLGSEGSRIATVWHGLVTAGPGLKTMSPGLGTERSELDTVELGFETVGPREETFKPELRTVVGNNVEEDNEKALRCAQLPCPAYELGPPVCACNYVTGKVATFKDMCDVKRHNCRYDTVFKVFLEKICPWEFKTRRTIGKPFIDYSDAKYYN